MPRPDRRRRLPADLNLERLEDRLAPAVFDNFNGGIASFNALFATNYNGVPGGTNFNWNATVGIADQNGGAGAGISAAQNTPLNDETAIYQPTVINLADGAVHTLSMFVTAAVGADSGDRILNIGLVNSPTGAFNNGFSYLSAKLLADHKAEFSFDNGPGVDAVENNTTTATGTIAANDWLQLVFTAQEIASNKFLCTFSLFDYGQTGTAAPTELIAPVTHTATTLNTLGNATTMYAGFRYGMSGNTTSPLSYDNFSLDSSNPDAPAAKMAILTQPTSGTAGTPLSALNIAIEDANSNVLFGDASTVTLTLDHGVFANGSTSATAQVSGGIASFTNLQINSTGTYVLTATDTDANLSRVTDSVTINLGASVNLVFLQQPTSASYGAAISPAVTVAIEDSAGNILTGDSSTVALTLTGSQQFVGGATVETAQAVGGVATFSGLVPLERGTFNLLASDGSLTSATSSPFVIADANLVYASATNFGLSLAPTFGQALDGDQGTPGTQTAVYGVTGFPMLAGALGDVTTSGTIVVNAGTYDESPSLTGTETFRLSGGDIAVDSIDSSAGATIDLGANTLTTGSTAGSDVLAGPIIGTGGLVKVGSDALTLSSAAGYTGPTTVSGGSLIVTGSLNGASAVAVAAGGTLGGTGFVGAVTSSGTVSPGLPGSTGALTTGNLTLHDATGVGVLAIDIAGPAAYDTVASTGSVDLTGASLNLAFANVTNGATFAIVTATSITGTFNGLPSTGSTVAISGQTFQVAYNPTSVVLTAVAPLSLVGNPVLNGGLSYIDSTLAGHQHSMVENVVYSFSQAVSLSTSNFTLTGSNGTTSAPNVALSSSAGGTIWIVTFTGTGVNNATHSIGDGEYALALGGVPGLAPSTFDFFRLLGDMDGDGTVSAADFSTLISTFLRATTDPLYLGADDLDGDNTIGGSDLSQFTADFLHTVPAPLPN